MGGKRKQEAIEKWKILISTTLIQSIVCGILESYGALFVPMMRTLFPKDSMKSVKAALIGSLGSGLCMGFSPISSYLAKQWGVLFCSITGAVLTFLATFSASFSTSFITMALTYGIMLGIGCSLLFITNSIIISQHFGEDSTIAFGLLGFGNGVINSIMPHLMVYAISNIGLAGTIRTICLIICPIIFLPFHWKEVDPEKERNSLSKYQKNMVLTGDNKTGSTEHNINHGNPFSKKSLKRQRWQSANSIKLQMSEDDFLEPDMIPLGYTNYLRNQSNKEQISDSSNTSSFDFSSSINETVNESTFFQIKKSFEPFKNKGFLNLSLAMIIASLGYQVANVHIVNYVDDLSLVGNPQLFLTCIGAASATGPLLNPFFVEKFEEHVSKFRIFQIFILGYGVAVTLLPLVTNYYPLMFTCALIGYFDGSFSTLIGPLIIELIGIEKSGDGIGIYYGSIALSVTIAAPLAGYLHDMTRNYTLPYFVAGLLFMFGGFMLSFTNTDIKVQQTKSEKFVESNTTTVTSDYTELQRVIKL